VWVWNVLGVVVLRRTTRVSDSRWQRTRNCNHSGLTILTVEIETHSGCSLHPIVERSRFAATGDVVAIASDD